MKIRKDNRGFTLIELIISLAILSFLVIAIVGVMSSNSTITKKTKADLTVQTSAQETYSKISEDVMQAKHVAIVGYKSKNVPDFKATDKGKQVAFSATEQTYVRNCDKDLLSEIPVGTDAYSKVHALKATDTNMDKSYWNTIRYMNEYEELELSAFLDKVNDNKVGTVNSFENINYSDGEKLVVTKIILQYSVPINNRYVPAGITIPTQNVSISKTEVVDGVTKTVYEEKNEPITEDICTEVFTFDQNKINVSVSYKYMSKLDSDNFDDNELYSNSLNYVYSGSDSSITNYSGVVATVDAAKNSIGIDLFFADKSMSYTSKGLTQIRNSHVLNDQK